MTATYTTTTPRHDEAGQIEKLLRYAMTVRYDAPVSHTRMVRIIRKAFRFGGARFALAAIDQHLHDATWAGLEIYVNGYADPTGALAAQRVDNSRGGGHD